MIAPDGIGGMKCNQDHRTLEEFNPNGVVINHVILFPDLQVGAIHISSLQD